MKTTTIPALSAATEAKSTTTESGKALAASYLFQEGTPIVYQGQEIGMTNIYPCRRLDVLRGRGRPSTIAPTTSQRINPKRSPSCSASSWGDARERAHARAVERMRRKRRVQRPATPWFSVNPNYPQINVAAQEDDPGSLLNFYREALRLRHELPVVRYGTFRQYYPLSNKLFVYERRAKRERLLVICSYSVNPVKFKAPRGYDLQKGQLLCKAIRIISKITASSHSRMRPAYISSVTKKRRNKERLCRIRKTVRRCLKGTGGRFYAALWKIRYSEHGSAV